jgi:hypothetical protein
MPSWRRIRRPRGLRSAGHHRHLRGGGRDHHHLLRGCAAGGAADHRAHRIRRCVVGLRLQYLRRAERHPVAVAGHRHGRGYGRRGRSGHDVRLCLQRDRRAHAAAHHAGPQAGAAAFRGAARGHSGFPAAGWQEPGQRGVRGRRAQAHGRGGGLDAAQRLGFDRDAARRSEEAHHRPGRPAGHGGFGHQLSHQSHRAFS